MAVKGRERDDRVHTGSDASLVLVADIDTLRDGLHDRSVQEDGWGSALVPEALRVGDA